MESTWVRKQCSDMDKSLSSKITLKIAFLCDEAKYMQFLYVEHSAQQWVPSGAKKWSAS